eukprot:1503080-Alexandrium_andersonii.AAC.1
MEGVLHIPAFSYVDDLLGAQTRRAARHAADCFARSVRATLGPSAVTEKKLKSGVPLVVLGLEVRLEGEG